MEKETDVDGTTTSMLTLIYGFHNTFTIKVALVSLSYVLNNEVLLQRPFLQKQPFYSLST